MDRIDGMRTFVAVVENGSFTAAGKRLGISNKLVSKYIGALEARLGINLLYRTTRSLSLTSEGWTYLQGVRRVLSELEVLDLTMDADGGISGTLKIAAPLTFGESVVALAALKMAQQHANIVLDLTLSDDYANLAEGGYDLAVRIGELQDSSLVARKLGETELIVVAAPSYIAEHGAPLHPSELSDHICVRDANNPDPNRWPFIVEGQRIHIPVAGPFIANSPPACLVPTYAGRGIFICPDVFLGNDLEEGRLVRLLEGFPSRTIPIQTVQLPSAFRKPKVAVFVELLREQLENRVGTR